MEKLPLSKRIWVVIVFTIFIPPLGVFLAWRAREYHHKMFYVSIGILVLGIIGPFFSDKDQKLQNISSIAIVEEKVDITKVENKEEKADTIKVENKEEKADTIKVENKEETTAPIKDSEFSAMQKMFIYTTEYSSKDDIKDLAASLGLFCREDKYQDNKVEIAVDERDFGTVSHSNRYDGTINAYFSESGKLLELVFIHQNARRILFVTPAKEKGSAVPEYFVDMGRHDGIVKVDGSRLAIDKAFRE